MRNKTIALTLGLLLTLTACGGDNEAAPTLGDNSMTAINIGESYEIPADENSDIETTIEVTLNSYECGLKQADQIILYNDGSTETERARPELGWDYCAFNITATNTGNEPTLALPTVRQAIAAGKTIAPGDDNMINMYATEASLYPDERLNPDASIEYTIFRSFPTGTKIEAVEIVRDEYSPEVVATVAVN